MPALPAAATMVLRHISTTETCHQVPAQGCHLDLPMSTPGAQHHRQQVCRSVQGLSCLSAALFKAYKIAISGFIYNSLWNQTAENIRQLFMKE